MMAVYILSKRLGKIVLFNEFRNKNKTFYDNSLFYSSSNSVLNFD